ncbi:EamA family transporter [Novilysobacter defluvii]|uniref:Transporter n=1 Tax=Lysobacter defluvii IMMIB APB-9 = DSM 18482 TaxID=1385515 RepID=A0A0A0M6N9_9GAMM|nr:EamA family transporter [Lysobacter defluvii]KGO97692.1 transporter [Lysobacter defluvii IMMIB APB-9 = DSM 18482]
MSPLNPSPATGVLLVIGSCLSLQFGAALADGLFPHLGPWGVTTLRLGLAALFLLAVARPAAWGWSRQAWTGVVLLGASLGAMNGFFFASIERLPLAVAVSFEFIGPLVLAALLSRSARDMLWVGIATAGMVLLGLESALGAESLDPVGIAFALVAGGFWAAYILCSARVGREVPGVGGLAVAMAIGALGTAILGAPGAMQALHHPELAGLILGVALLSSVVPYTLELAALRRLSKPTFSVLLSLEPVFAAAVAWVMLDQTFGWLRALAIALVVAASIGTTRTAVQLSRRRAREALPPAAIRHTDPAAPEDAR